MKQLLVLTLIVTTSNAIAFIMMAAKVDKLEKDCLFLSQYVEAWVSSETQIDLYPTKVQQSNNDMASANTQ